MRSIVYCVVFVLSLVAVSGAQETSMGTRTAELVAPLGDASALAVARVDVAKIDLAAALDWAAKTMKASEEERAQMERGLAEPQQFLKLFREAGGQELVLLVYPATAQAGLREPVEFSGVVTVAAGKAKPMSDLLKSILPAGRFEVAERNDCVRFAPPHRLKEIDEAAKASPELAKALDGAGPGTVQAVFLLPEDMRRVVRENLPRLPDEFGGFSGKEVAEWFAWGALSADLPPKPRLRLTVQTTSPEAARAIEKSLARWYELGGASQEIREHVPNFNDIIPLLTPKASGEKVVLSLGEKPGDLEKLLPMIVLPIQAARNAATRAQHMNTLKQIGLALHNYHDTHAHFPAQASYSKDGKKSLLSWRVHILPFLDEAALYKEFRLDEPWDSEHNKKLIEKIPDVYVDPRVPIREKGRTTFVAPIGEGTVFGGKEGMKMQKIVDGTSNTILIVESDAPRAVIWTKPDDLKVDPALPLEGIFVDADKQISVLFADGSVRVIPAKDAAKLPAYFTAGGGEVVQP